MRLIIGRVTGADPGFFLGGGALVSCSTSTQINHIVFFFCRIPVVLEDRRSSPGGVRTPCTLPLDPPLSYHNSSICTADRGVEGLDNTLRDLLNFFLIVKGFLIYAILELRLSPNLIIVYPSLSSQRIFFLHTSFKSEDEVKPHNHPLH